MEMSFSKRYVCLIAKRQGEDFLASIYFVEKRTSEFYNEFTMHSMRRAVVDSSYAPEIQTITKHLSCPAIIVSQSGMVLHANDLFLSHFPLDTSEIMERTLGELLGILRQRGITVLNCVDEDTDEDAQVPEGTDYHYRCKSLLLPFVKASCSICLFLEKNQVEEDNFTLSDLYDFLEHANDLINVVGLDGIFLYVNKAWRKTLGYSIQDVRNMVFTDIIADDCQDRFRLFFDKLIQGHAHEEIELSFQAKDGSLIHVRGNCNCRFRQGRPHSIRGIFQEVTDEKKSHGERKSTGKGIEKAKLFESLGLMAGGIAHDFNNILMIILGFTELLKARTDFSKELRYYINKIENSARRAEALTLEMLAFAGAGSIYVEQWDLSELIKNMQPLIFSMINPKTALRFRLQDDLSLVEIDPNQVMHAVKNIVKNAAEAIDPNGGTIKLTTGQIVAHKGFFHDAVLDEDLPQGTYCYIEIMDNGTGMRPEMLDKAFEPFFTTKFAGRGLGLSATLGIVRAHRGAVKMVSSPEEGTKVTIFLPAKDNSL